MCVHPSNRQLRLNGAECTAFSCTFNHPSSRMAHCDQGNKCSNFYCAYLHPPDWNPCETGNNCTDVSCSHAIHSGDRVLNQKQEANDQEPPLSISQLLKSVEQWQIEREKVQLPILTWARTAQFFFDPTALNCYSVKEPSCSGSNSDCKRCVLSKIGERTSTCGYSGDWQWQKYTATTVCC